MPFKLSSSFTPSGRMHCSSYSSSYQLPSLISSTTRSDGSIQNSTLMSSVPAGRDPYFDTNDASSITSSTIASSSASMYHSCHSYSSSSGTTINTDTTNSTTRQSVKPYRFRDEPNKKKIVKTELCRAVVEGRACPFGHKCNFAHHESELKYQTLFERDEAKLCDIETHRTRPCFNHLATGDCPFGPRCTCLHDKRVDGEVKWWLPNCALKSTHLDTNVHVEWFAKDIFALSHYGHPFGKDRNPSMPILHSFHNFYTLITNNDKADQLSQNHATKLHGGPQLQQQKIMSESQRLCIALHMRHNYSIIKRIYRYQPTHKILNEICMLVQTKAFNLCNSSVVQITLDDFNPKNPNHIIVREIAFGPLSSPSDRPLALWFNILHDDVEECTQKEMLRLKRTERKLLDRKKLAAQKKVAIGTCRTSYADITSSSAKSCHYVPSSFDDKHPAFEKQFEIYSPMDKISYELTTDVLRYQLNLLQSKMVPNVHDKKFKDLEKRFCAVRNHFSNLNWPVNKGREIVDKGTLVPNVNTQYTVPEISNDKNSYQAKIWNSFVNTASEFSEDNKISLTNTGNSRTRCGVFKTLSKGVSLSYCSLPHIKSHSAPPGLSPEIGVLTKKQEHNWDIVQAHYLSKKEAAQLQKNLVTITEQRGDEL